MSRLATLITEARRLCEWEAYVDKDGYAHDDEGNVWFVGKEYADGTYGLGQLPLGGPDKTVPYGKLGKSGEEYWQDHLGKILAALVLKGRKADFIQSVFKKKVYKGWEPSIKQQQAVSKVASGVKSEIAKFPKGIKWTIYMNGNPGFAKATDAQRKWAEENFEIDWFEPTKRVEVLGKAKKGAPKPSAAPMGKGANQDQIDALVQALEKRSNNFLDSILKQVKQGRVLSDKQLKAVRQNLYRLRMKDKADLFR